MPVLTQKLWMLLLLLVGITSSVCLHMAGVSEGQAHERAHHPRPGGRYTRAVSPITIPQVDLVRADGQPIALRTVLATAEPVLLSFIFTSCPSVCPVMSAVLSQFQERLATTGDTVQMVSISIDPDHDTPQALATYAQKFQAGSRWQFYTGRRDAILTVQRAFNAYRGDKMNHPALTFMRTSPQTPWVRLEGVLSADELAVEYRSLIGRH